MSTDKLPDGRPYLITRKEFLMGRDVEFPLSAQLETNLAHTLEVMNKIRYAYGKPMSVSSGYRPGHYNTDAHGAKGSAHLSCEACDFGDGDGSLDKWCQANKPLLISLGLRLESVAHTPGWCHLDTRYRSGDPEFIP